MAVTGRNIAGFILASGLALLLSGCYAATGNYAYTPAGTYTSHGTTRYAPSGHTRYEHKRHYRNSARKADHTLRQANGDPSAKAEIRTAAQGPKPPRTASGHGGRGDESIAVPTARDEGPRPGAEGGAR